MANSEWKGPFEPPYSLVATRRSTFSGISGGILGHFTLTPGILRL
jgi:hypothetical protein